MNVLIVSHNLISGTSNMGKTLLSYFRNFSVGEISQFYIHSEIPVEDSLCHSYFRFTDRDALRSLLPFTAPGRVFGKQDICTDRISSRTDTGMLGAVYQLGRKRTALIYALRNLLWNGSRWNTGAFQRWLDVAAPDVVFLAAGDYGFMYDIAREIAESLNLPLAVACVDDFYLHNRNGTTAFGRMVHRSFLKQVQETMDYATVIFTICEEMKEAYEPLFGKKCCVLHTAASPYLGKSAAPGEGIVYLGNVSAGRGEQLAALGRALRNLALPGIPGWIDVYSGERNPELFRFLTEENGIRFHGAVSSQRAMEILQGSMAAIHTESFDPAMQRIVRYSVSTKIADTLRYGPCLIAYGPEGIASMDYLAENRAAYRITSPQRLEQDLTAFFTNPQLRQALLHNARELAERNHRPEGSSAVIRAQLTRVCEAWNREG